MASVVWGIMTASQAAFIGSVTAGKAAALWGHAANELPLWAVRYPFAPRMGLDRWGSSLLRGAVGEESLLGSLLIGNRPDRTRSLWAINQDALDVYRSTAATGGWEAGARAGAVRSLTGGGIWRYGGAAGGVAATGFNASFTAMMVCPNPVTVGATVVTGVAWAAPDLLVPAIARMVDLRLPPVAVSGGVAARCAVSVPMAFVDRALTAIDAVGAADRPEAITIIRAAGRAAARRRHRSSDSGSVGAGQRQGWVGSGRRGTGCAAVPRSAAAGARTCSAPSPSPPAP